MSEEDWRAGRVGGFMQGFELADGIVQELETENTRLKKYIQELEHIKDAAEEAMRFLEPEYKNAKKKGVPPVAITTAGSNYWFTMVENLRVVLAQARKEK